MAAKRRALEKKESYAIIPPSLAIKSMRSSGYRDAAHAVAELIDNSIQAGDGVSECTNVEVLCIDRKEMVSERVRRRIDRVAVYDNASGMDAATLRIALQFGNGVHLDREGQKGIGKFGMGLPNEYEFLRREAAAKARVEQTLPGR